MHVLLLSPYPGHIVRTLDRIGDSFSISVDPLTEAPGADFIVSYGYRHIIKEPVLGAFKNRIINIHMSLLPWNRGADPNFWSWFDGTPKGATIHEIDSGIDTGPILVQRKLEGGYDDTLNGSYERLRCLAEILFKHSWPLIRDGEISAIPQSAGGSHHAAKDKEKFWKALPLGYDTPTQRVTDLGKQFRRQTNQESLCN